MARDVLVGGGGGADSRRRGREGRWEEEEGGEGEGRKEGGTEIMMETNSMCHESSETSKPEYSDTPLNPSQTVLPIWDPQLKQMSLWRPFSLKWTYCPS